MQGGAEEGVADDEHRWGYERLGEGQRHGQVERRERPLLLPWTGVVLRIANACLLQCGSISVRSRRTSTPTSSITAAAWRHLGEAAESSPTAAPSFSRSVLQCRTPQVCTRRPGFLCCFEQQFCTPGH